MQIARVGERLAQPEPWDPSNPEGTINVFRSSGLLPEALLGEELLSDRYVPSPPWPPREWVAAAFSAAAYPQRAYQMKQERGERLAAFLDFWRAWNADTVAESHLPEAMLKLLTKLERLPAELTVQDGLALFSDLTAAGLIGESAKDGAGFQERIVGAAWFLSTCPPPLANRIAHRWRTERPLAAYVRQRLSVPPSQSLTRPLEHVRFDALAHALQQEYPQFQPSELHREVAALEMDVRNRAARCVARAQVPDCTEQFWHATYDKFTSGFPYYSFQSSLSEWWKECANHWAFNDSKMTSNAEQALDMAADRDGLTSGALTLSELGQYREVYRVARSTFIRLPQKGLDSETVAEQNEVYRRAADALWRQRLKLAAPGELPATAIREVAAQFQLGQSEAETLSERLLRRVKAAGLARFQRWPNSQIASMRLGKNQGKPEAGLLTVATLAKTASRHGGTLLWCFALSIFQHDTVRPQHRDPWNFRRFVVELWHWATGQAFAEALRSGVEAGEFPETTMSAALDRAPLRDFYRHLASLPDETAVQTWLAGQELSSIESAVEQELDRSLGNQLTAFGRKAVARWRKLVRQGEHWIVPVWYLTCVERLPPEKVLQRLVVDDYERSAVSELCRAIDRECNLEPEHDT